MTIINKDIIRLTEAEINRFDYPCKIIKALNFFNIDFSNNENKFLSLPYGCRNVVAVLGKFYANDVPIFGFKKHAFVNRVFNLILVYIKQSLSILQLRDCTLSMQKREPEGFREGHEIFFKVFDGLQIIFLCSIFVILFLS